MEAHISLKRETYAEIEAKYACGHQERQLRCRVIADGRTTYVDQCIRCGHTSNPIKESEARKRAGGKAIPPYDELVQPRLRAAKSAEYFVAYLRIKPALAAEYQSYLASAAWQKRRAAAIARAQGVCELCGEHPASEVHHMTYQNIGNEKLDELLAVCAECHGAIHGKINEA